MTYYNTVGEEGELLKKYEAQTEGQEKKVLLWFREHPYREITAWDVYEILFSHTKVPEKSARRAVTNIKNAGAIEKTGDKVVSGPFQRSCFLYRLKRKPTPPVQQRLI